MSSSSSSTSTSSTTPADSDDTVEPTAPSTTSPSNEETNENPLTNDTAEPQSDDLKGKQPETTDNATTTTEEMDAQIIDQDPFTQQEQDELHAMVRSMDKSKDIAEAFFTLESMVTSLQKTPFTPKAIHFFTEVLPLAIQITMCRSQFAQDDIPGLISLFSTSLTFFASQLLENDLLRDSILGILRSMFNTSQMVYLKVAKSGTDWTQRRNDLRMTGGGKFKQKDVKEFAGFPQHDRTTSVLYVLNINSFAAAHGFVNLTALFDSHPELGSEIMEIIKPTLKYLTLKAHQHFGGALEKVITRRIDALDPTTLRNQTTKDSLFNQITVLGEMIRTTTSGMQTLEKMGELELMIVQKCLDADVMDVRISGLTDLKRMAKKPATASILNLSANSRNRNLNGPAMHVTKDHLLRFISEAELLQKLFTGQIHPEILKNSTDLLVFITRNKKMQMSTLRSLVDSCIGQHEAIKHLVLNFIRELLDFLAYNPMRTLFEESISKFPYSEYDVASIDFLRDFTKCALNKRPRADHSKMFGLTILWDLIQDDALEHITKEASHAAYEALDYLLGFHGMASHRPEFMDMCVINIGESRSVQRSLRLLSSLISHIKNPREKNITINSLQQKHNLLNLAFNDLLQFEYETSESVEQASSSSTSSTTSDSTGGDDQPKQEVSVIDPETRLDNISTRLQFLELILRNSNLVLNEAQVDMLWHALVTDAKDERERHLWFKWLTTTNIQNQGGFQAFSSQTVDYIFTEKMCTLEFVSIVDQTAFVVFQRLFKAVNQQNGCIVLKKKTVSGFLAQKFEFSGLTTLWSIALDTADRSVSMDAIRLLCNLYLEIGPNTATKQWQIRESFVTQCMENLAENASQLSKDKKQKSESGSGASSSSANGSDDSNEQKSIMQLMFEQRVTRCLEILHTFLSSFAKNPELNKEAIAVFPSLGPDPRGIPISVTVTYNNKVITIQCFSNDSLMDLRAQLAPEIGYDKEFSLSFNKKRIKDDDKLLSELKIGHKSRLVARTVFNGTSGSGSSSSNGGDLSPANPSHSRKRSKGITGWFRKTDGDEEEEDEEDDEALSQLRDQVSALGMSNSSTKSASKPGLFSQLAAKLSGKKDLTPAEVLSAENHMDNLVSLFDASRDIATQVWSVLRLLPTSAKVLESFDKVQDKKKASSVSWDELFQSEFSYRQLYSLLIVDSVIQSLLSDSSRNRAQTIKWCKNFAESGGVEYLYSLLLSVDFMDWEDEGVETVQLECIGLIFRLINFFSLEPLFEDNQSMLQIGRVASFVDYDRLVNKLIEALFTLGSQGINRVAYTTQSVLEDGELARSIMAYLISLAELGQDGLAPMFESELLGDCLFRLLLLSPSESVRENTASAISRMCQATEETLMMETPPVTFFTRMMLEFMDKMDQSAKCFDQYFVLLEELIQNSFEQAPQTMSETDPNSLRNTTVVNKYVSMIKDQPIRETAHNVAANEPDSMLLGLFNMVRLLTKGSASLQFFAGNHQHCALVEELVHNLFQLPSFDNPVSKRQQPPKCKTERLRQGAFNLLLTLVSDCAENYSELSKLLASQVAQVNKRDEWAYAPANRQKSSSGFLGLKNQGSTCYMNATMQQLFHVKQFRDDMLRITDASEDKSDSPLYQMQVLFAYLMESEMQYYNTLPFCMAYKDLDGNPINLHRQEDANEFLNILFERIDGLMSKSGPQNVLKRYFGGKQLDQVISHECQHMSGRPIDFFTLSLSIKNKRSVQEALDLFVDGEVLSGNNKYKCERCDAYVDATKRTCVTELPRYLMIHLIRFDFDFELFTNVKIKDAVEFSPTLNMEPYTLQGLSKRERAAKQTTRLSEQPEVESESEEAQGAADSDGGDVEQDDVESAREEELMRFLPKEHYSDGYYTYDLVGILVHSGVANGGHYYSYIKVSGDGVVNDEPSFVYEGEMDMPSSSSATQQPSYASAAANGSASQSNNQHENDDDAHSEWNQVGGKWMEFNDRRVMPFNTRDIPDCCFGGELPKAQQKKTRGVGSIMGYNPSDFDDNMKPQSAYMLIYKQREYETTPIEDQSPSEEEEEEDVDEQGEEREEQDTESSEVPSMMVEEEEEEVDEKEIDTETIAPAMEVEGLGGSVATGGHSALMSSEALNELVDDSDASDMRAKLRRRYPGVPSEVWEFVWGENQLFLQEMHFFDTNFFNFCMDYLSLVLDLCDADEDESVADDDETTNEETSTSESAQDDEGQKKEGVEAEPMVADDQEIGKLVNAEENHDRLWSAYLLGSKVLLNVMGHSKHQELFVQGLNTLAMILNSDEGCAIHFIRHCTQNREWIHQMLLHAPNVDMRRAFESVLWRAINTVGYVELKERAQLRDQKNLQQSQQMATEDEQTDAATSAEAEVEEEEEETVILQAAVDRARNANNQLDTLNDTLDDISDVDLRTDVSTQSTEEYVGYLAPFFEKFRDLLKPAHKSRPNYGEYLALLRGVISQGYEETAILLKLGYVSQLVNFYLLEDTSTAVNSSNKKNNGNNGKNQSKNKLNRTSSGSSFNDQMAYKQTVFKMCLENIALLVCGAQTDFFKEMEAQHHSTRTEEDETEEVVGEEDKSEGKKEKGKEAQVPSETDDEVTTSTEPEIKTVWDPESPIIDEDIGDCETVRFDEPLDISETECQSVLNPKFLYQAVSDGIHPNALREILRHWCWKNEAGCKIVFENLMACLFDVDSKNLQPFFDTFAPILAMQDGEGMVAWRQDQFLATLFAVVEVKVEMGNQKEFVRQVVHQLVAVARKVPALKTAIFNNQPRLNVILKRVGVTLK